MIRLAKREVLEHVFCWLAPSLLLAVALQHLYLVYFRDLTPWIGGGFGMYAVIDTHRMRTASGECLDPDGRPCVLYLPFGGEKPFVRSGPDTLLRIKHDEDMRHRITDQLFRSKWVRTDLSEIAREAYLGKAIRLLPKERRGGPFYRVVTAQHSAETRKRAVALPAIRIQMWKLVFNAERGIVTCERWGSAVERGNWP